MIYQFSSSKKGVILIFRHTLQTVSKPLSTRVWYVDKRNDYFQQSIAPYHHEIDFIGLNIIYYAITRARNYSMMLPLLKIDCAICV
jgi:hypothetical protein